MRWLASFAQHSNSSLLVVTGCQVFGLSCDRGRNLTAEASVHLLMTKASVTFGRYSIV